MPNCLNTKQKQKFYSLCGSDSKIKLDREAYLQAKEICEKVNKENKFIMHATDKRVSPLKRCGK